MEDEDGELKLQVGVNAFVCIVCKQIMHLDCRLRECPGRANACKREICVACTINALDKTSRNERQLRCFCCQSPAYIEDFARVLDLTNNLVFRMRPAPREEDHVVADMDEDMEFDNEPQVPNVDQPRHDPEQDFDNACNLGGACIRQNPNNDQTKVKCPSCFLHYHVACLLEEIRIAEQSGDEFKCHCNIRSNQMWQQYVLDPRNWITDEDDLR